MDDSDDRDSDDSFQQRKVDWANDHQAEDHVLMLQVACRDQTESSHLYTLRWAATDDLVFSTNRKLRRKVNERRQVHIRSIWKRFQPIPQPNFQLLAQFKQCKFIEDLIKHSMAKTKGDLAKRKGSRPGRSVDMDADPDDSVIGSVGHGEDNEDQGQMVVGAKKVDQNQDRYITKIRGKYATLQGKLVVELKIGKNSMINAIVAVNPGGRLSDDGLSRKNTLMIFFKLDDPGDASKV